MSLDDYASSVTGLLSAIARQPSASSHRRQDSGVSWVTIDDILKADNRGKNTGHKKHWFLAYLGSPGGVLF